MFQLHRAIITPLPKNRSISDFRTIGIPKVYDAEVYCLRCMVKLKLLELKWISVCWNKLKYYVITMLLKLQVSLIIK
jgi:hypothetical protein